jgi:ACR3 family arsenite efflux pump ArsB
MFWRVAHKYYRGKSPSVLTEAATFIWALFFILVYGAALLSGWRPDVAEAFVGTVLIGVPLTIGVLHRRIRIEASKGSDALYRKRIEAND